MTLILLSLGDTDDSADRAYFNGNRQCAVIIGATLWEDPQASEGQQETLPDTARTGYTDRLC